MKILGIDPGVTRIGYGIIEQSGSTLKCLGYGVIKNAGTDRAQDFRNTTSEMQRLIKKFSPDAAVIERLFFSKNQKTAMAVSEMRGVILLSLAQGHIPVSELTPMEVKRFISGYGLAEKLQVQNMVRLVLHIQEQIRPDDAADALALALCGSAPRQP